MNFIDRVEYNIKRKAFEFNLLQGPIKNREDIHSQKLKP